MKNVMICASALLAGGLAFAQPPQTVTPQTEQATAVAATVGGGLSTIDQVGIGNDAVAIQEGTMNTSYIDQTGTSATDRNFAYVGQSGNVGDGGAPPYLSGVENYADLTQSGSLNYMVGLQLGDDNTAWGDQMGTGNKAWMQQGDIGARQAQDNYAEVSQNGMMNEAEVQQRFDNNIASSTQDNDGLGTLGNRSYQEQVSAGNQSNGHTAISTQRGDDNEVRQFQTGPNSAIGNYAEANQGDIAGTDTATGAYAEQIQSGSGQQAYINQKLAGDEAYQEQLGADNTAIANQNLGGVASGGNNFSGQHQDGTDNMARTTQNGNNNESLQEQFGNDNKALTVQTFGQSTGNYAQSIQNGSFNDSSIKQASNGNFAQVDQFGSNHMSIVNQNQLGTSLGNAAANGSNTAFVLQRDANGLSIPVQALLKPIGSHSPAAKSLASGAF